MPNRATGQHDEPKYRAIIDTAVDAIVVIAEDGIIQAFNPAAERIFGYRAAEVIDRNVSMLMPEPDRTSHDSYIGNYHRTGRAKIIGIGREVTGRRKDGSVFPLDLSIAEWRADGRRFFTGIMRDVTERRLAEARRRADEARYRAIVDTAVDAIAVIDARGIVQSFNRAAERTFGYAAQEVVGRNVSMLMPEPDRSSHDGYLANYFRTGQAKIIGVGREVQGQRKDGALFPLELSIAEWHDVGGERFFTGIMRDISERKRAEEALRRLNETLEQRVADRTQALEEANRRLTAQMETLQRAQKALQDATKMEAIGQLTGGIAHDFNNLLTAIAGNLDLIAAIGGDARVRGLVDAAQRAIDRGARLTAQLLAFARRQRLHPERVRLTELLREFSILMTRAAGEATEVSIGGDADLWPCLVDPAQFQSAMLNLVVNARDAMPGGGRLRIEVRNVNLDEAATAGVPELRPGAYVVVTVQDTGSGMSQEIAARAFEPFFTTKDVGKGTGLGLSQVYGFARQSGGTAILESHPGRGTAVRLFLPRVAGEETTAYGTHGAAPTLSTGGSETVLVVEDDPNVLETVVNSVSTLGYSALVAHNGAEAMRVLASNQPIDLLLTDIVMPGGINGTELARRARQMRPGLRVLLTTGYAAVNQHERLELDDSLPLLHKPYRRDDLARKLRDVLDAPPRPL